MLDFENGGHLIQDASELPDIPAQIKHLYVDAETGSNDPRETSLNPWIKGRCTVIGIAVTWDNMPKAYYIPRDILLTARGHNWMQCVFSVAQSWVNHNVKYDVHAIGNDLNFDFEHCDFVCTVAMAHVYDADRTFKGGYNLTALARTLLNRDITPYEMRLKPYLNKNKDYTRIPLDIIGEYACEDVLVTRELFKFLHAHIPEESTWVAENEIKLTKVLVDIERNGMYIDKTRVKIKLLQTLNRMLEIDAELQKALGYKLLPTSYNEVYDLLINCWGFPAIHEEGKKNASFNKATLNNYASMPGDFVKYREVINLIKEFRSCDTHRGLFWESWLELADDSGLLHGDYQQNRRSGRTACKQPNSQQLDIIAKDEIRAEDGHVLLCFDYSQQEYRWMIHYLQNPAGIKAYRENPNMDYHQWVADTLCGGAIKRRPAKTLNFTIGFGGGKERVVSMLSIVDEVIELAREMGMSVREFALRVFYNYHRNLSELRSNQRMAEVAALRNGYVKTVYGRHLHLPEFAAYKGFNRVVQSTAADNSKEAAVEVSPVYNQKLKNLGVKFVAFVHDEYLFSVPNDANTIEDARVEIKRCLEIPSKRCRVPIVADCGPPALTWKGAKP